MKNRSVPANAPMHRIRPIACAAVLATAFTILLPRTASAAQVTPPPVPGNLEPPAGSKAFLEGHAVGTQNYICLPSDSGFAWSLFTPQATLSNDDGKQLITHFFSPNPDEHGIVRAAWQHSRDTSTVWAVLDQFSTDARFVAPGAIPWLKLKRAGSLDGPTGGDALSATSWIQRLNTSGGVAPSTGCSMSTDVGKKAFVPYTADYFFYFTPDADTDGGN